MVEKIWFLRSGSLDLDQSALQFGRGYGNTIRIPVYCILIRTSEGYGLVDTGQNTLGIADPEGTWGNRARVFVPNLEPEDDVAGRLATIGVEPREIGWVIQTHLHWDHTGGNRHFTQADFYVQREEYRYALYPNHHFSASYMPNHFGAVKEYRLVEGDCRLFDDIWLISSPGHTAGHQSVLLRMQDGAHVILPGDAIYGEDNIRLLLPPGNCWNGVEASRSLRKLIALAGITNARIFPSHESDPEFFIRAEEYLRRFQDPSPQVRCVV